MLQITEDTAHNALIAEPGGKLTKTDFETLTERFNAVVNQTDRIPNLVIHTRDFPGWSDFSALVEHLQFIQAHQRLIGKIALVSDSRILDIAPRIARHFVSARIRHFPADHLAEALDWSAEPQDHEPHVSIMEGLPDNVVGISVRGVITAKDYSETITPLIEGKLKGGGKIGFLYHIGPEFEAFTPGAAWSDARVGLMNLTGFSRIAVVSDLPWIRHGMRIFAPLVPAEVHVFPEADLDAAKSWVAGGASEEA